MNSSPQSPLIHPFIHSLIHLPLPSTELCKNDKGMVCALEKYAIYSQREADFAKPQNNEIHVLTGMCAQRTGETKGDA